MYVTRHRRRDLVVSYIINNVGLIDTPATAFEPTLTTAYRRTTVLLPASAHNTVDSRMTIDAETSGGTVIVNGSETGTATETSGATAGGMGGFVGRP